MRTDGQVDMMQFIVAFRNSAKAPQTLMRIFYNEFPPPSPHFPHFPDKLL